MSFRALYDLYMEDIKPRIRPTTYRSKEYMFAKKVLPFFADLPCDQITPAKIRQWQNELVKGNYQETYLRTINNQVTAIFNFAVNYYGLPTNPVKRAGLIGRAMPMRCGSGQLMIFKNSSAAPQLHFTESLF